MYSTPVKFQRKVLEKLYYQCPWDKEFYYENEYKNHGQQVDVIFGSWKNRDVDHHNLKRQIIRADTQVMILETPLLSRGPVTEAYEGSWYRVGLNGFMANGIFPKRDVSKTIEMLGLRSFCTPKLTNNDYILIPLQLPGDASLDHTDINEWVVGICHSIRSLTNRDIVIRLPQLERNYSCIEKLKEIPDIYFQQGTFDNLKVTLDNAHSVVTYSSGMGVEAVLKGIPVYSQSENAFVGHRNLQDVVVNRDPPFESEDHYQNVIKLLAQTQWHVDEFDTAEFWESFKRACDG